MLRILDHLLPPDNYATVARLNHDAFLQSHTGVLSAEAMRQSNLDAAIESWSKFPNPNCQYGFAYDGDTLVGFTVVNQCRMKEYAEYGEMNSLYVHVDHQKRGVGRALLDWAKQSCCYRNFTRMYVRVVVGNEACDFYRLTGATFVSIVQRPVFGIVTDLELLCYQLD